MPSLQPEQFDMVIADPPYGRAFLGLWADLARESRRVLKPGGSFLAIVPHYALPEILGIVGEQLKYRWICCMWQHGHRVAMRIGVRVFWKPVVWWVKDAWPRGRGFALDGIWIAGKEKSYLRHQQSLDWARWALDFSPPGSYVLDPMMGSGTILVAAKEMGYRAVGIEADPDVFEAAVGRLRG